LSVATAAEADEPNEAQGLSRKSHHHATTTYRENETTTALIVEPTSTSVDVVEQGFSLRRTDATTSDSDSDAELELDLEWPWSSGNSDNNNKTQEDRTCAGHTNCSTCADASWCHWCGHDCHARGSIHGCIYGASCDSKKPPKNKNETDPSGCGAHNSCSECAISSHLCHWCAHDNACHSVGSVYGCVGGVDCYSNSICERKEPEPIVDTVFTQIGPLPLLVLLVLSAVLLCCASTCFCVAGGVKGAYDDLAGITADRAADADGGGGMEEPLLRSPQQPQPPQQSWISWGAAPLHRLARIVMAEPPEPVVPTTADVDADADQVAEENGDAAANDSVHMVLSEEGNNTSEDDVRLANDETGEGAEAAPLWVVPTQQRTTTRAATRRPRHMQRLYNACTVCYIFTVAVISALLFGAVHYFPAKPVYNICNDNVAWKSLIDSMASMKVSADFEILASVNNPNHFDVALDMGKSRKTSLETNSSVTSLALSFWITVCN
jgi:hypothetical protein